MKYFLFILVGCALGFLAAKLFIKPKEYAPVIIHTDTYKAKYEVAFNSLRKKDLVIDSLKKLQKQKYNVVHEKNNDSSRITNIPRSFTELADYLNQ